MPDIPPDLQKFLTLCQRGNLYEFLIKKMGWKRTRDEWKDEVWFWFLYGTAKSEKQLALQGREDLRELTQVFRRQFPNVYWWITLKKSGDKGGLARQMQTIESKIIIGGVVGSLAKYSPHVPFVTIHDSLMVLPEHVDQVRWLMIREFGRYGVNPLVKIDDGALRMAA